VRHGRRGVTTSNRARVQICRNGERSRAAQFRRALSSVQAPRPGGSSQTAGTLCCGAWDFCIERVALPWSRRRRGGGLTSPTESLHRAPFLPVFSALRILSLCSPEALPPPPSLRLLCQRLRHTYRRLCHSQRIQTVTRMTRSSVFSLLGSRVANRIARQCHSTPIQLRSRGTADPRETYMAHTLDVLHVTLTKQPQTVGRGDTESLVSQNGERIESTLKLS
jgi:hypothetical protein